MPCGDGGGGGECSRGGGRTGIRRIGNGGSGRIGRVDRIGRGRGGKGDRTMGGKLRCVVVVGGGKYSGTRSPRGLGAACGGRREGATKRSPKEVKTFLVLSRISGVTFVVIGGL